MKTAEKDKIYNTIALKQYELEELKGIKSNLCTMDKDYKAEMTIITIHTGIFGGISYKKKSTTVVVPQLLIQIIDKLIENKREYLDKAINLAAITEMNKEREEK